MGSQLTIRISSDLREALDRASRRTGMKNPELVRQALRRYLQTSADPQQPPAARVRHLIGSLASGIPDLAERHREYVIVSVDTGELLLDTGALVSLLDRSQHQHVAFTEYFEA